MTFPDELAMKAFAGGEVLPGGAFRIFVPTTRLPIELLPIGPSDAVGEYRVGGERLAQMTSEAASLGIMDHGALLAELWVRVLNLAEIAAFRDGFKTWAPSAGSFPEDYLDQLDAFEAVLKPHAGEELRVVAAAKGGSMRIGTSAQRA